MKEAEDTFWACLDETKANKRAIVEEEAVVAPEGEGEGEAAVEGGDDEVTPEPDS
jgi:hypothetical protein